MSSTDEELDLAIALSLQESYHNESKTTSKSSNKTTLERGYYLNDDESFALALSLQDYDERDKTDNERLDNINKLDFWSSIFNWNTLASNAVIPNSTSTPHNYVCFECNKPWTHGIKMNNSGRYYHSYCFKCTGCNRRIDESFVTRNDGQPYHFHCSQELFHPKCRLCRNTIDGRYFHHPYFVNEKYCVSHDLTNWRICCSCRRYEPLINRPSSSTAAKLNNNKNNNNMFQDLSDGRCICSECADTIVLDSTEAAAWYQQVIHFMECELNLLIPSQMRQVPILAVDIPTLNEQQHNSNEGHHHHNNNNNINQQCLTRGLTLHSVSTTTTTTIIPYMTKGGIKSIWEQSNQLFFGSSNNYNNDNNNSSSSRCSSDHNNTTYHNHSTSSVRTDEVREVTAVLVLYGLPRALTASILAHEAMHVWMKLCGTDGITSSSNNVNNSLLLSSSLIHMKMPLDLPSQVEEGLCQLIAYLYLTWLLGSTSTTSSSFDMYSNTTATSSHSSQQQLTNNTTTSITVYFLQSISQDTNEIYGTGFRKAYACYKTLGSLQVLLEYVRIYREFPSI